MGLVKNYQELQSYASFTMGFTEYVHLPIFAMKEFEKNMIKIKEEKSKAYAGLRG